MPEPGSGLDHMCGEAIDDAHRLWSARVDVELRVIPGVPYGFELFVPDAEVSKRAVAVLARALRSV